MNWWIDVLIVERDQWLKYAIISITGKNVAGRKTEETKALLIYRISSNSRFLRELLTARYPQL